MPALEPARGLRVVAAPSALDGARWAGDAVTVLRIAPDEALAVGATSVTIADEHAVVETETGFVSARVDPDELRSRIEWSFPTGRPALAQGSIAGVPAKLWLADDGATLVVQAAYAAELADRLGWDR